MKFQMKAGQTVYAWHPIKDRWELARAIFDVDEHRMTVRYDCGGMDYADQVPVLPIASPLAGYGHLVPVSPYELKTGAVVWAKVRLTRDGDQGEWDTLVLTDDKLEDDDFCLFIEHLPTSAEPTISEMLEVLKRKQADVNERKHALDKTVEWLQDVGSF